MDNPTFFQTAIKSIAAACDEYDSAWQIRRRKISTWITFQFLHLLIGSTGQREILAEFDLEKKACRPPQPLLELGQKLAGEFSVALACSFIVSLLTSLGSSFSGAGVASLSSTALEFNCPDP